MSTETIYKIRNPLTGLFSKGGYSPVQWTAKGKIWRGLGPLKSHLHGVSRRDYTGCELVTLEVVTTEGGLTPMSDLLDAHDKRKADKEQADKDRLTKAREKRERREARKLLAKYGPNP